MTFGNAPTPLLRTGGTLATGHDGLEAAQRKELRAAAHQVSTARQARTWQQSPGPGARDLADDLAHGRDAPTRHAPGSWRLAGQAFVHEAWNLDPGRVFGEVAELVAALAPLGATAASGFLDQAGELLAARGPGTGETDAG